MTKEKLEKVQNKISKDWMKLIGTYAEATKEDIINDAYRIAHYNEVVDFFDCIDEEYPPFDEEIFDHILAYKENVILKIWKDWLDYSHPERYNFFNYESLCDIIMWSFKN